MSNVAVNANNYPIRVVRTSCGQQMDPYQKHEQFEQAD